VTPLRQTASILVIFGALCAAAFAVTPTGGSGDTLIDKAVDWAAAKSGQAVSRESASAERHAGRAAKRFEKIMSLHADAGSRA
jgi:hypothetical protein